MTDGFDNFGTTHSSSFTIIFLSVFASAFAAPAASSQTGCKTFLRLLFHHLVQQTARSDRT